MRKSECGMRNKKGRGAPEIGRLGDQEIRSLECGSPNAESGKTEVEKMGR
jgi:hypothetical protein